MHEAPGALLAPKKYVKEFEGLRAVLACWVVLGHAFVSLPVGADSHRGSLFNVDAVDVFIILSGFVIFSLLDGSRGSTYYQYITARFFRIFPAFFLVLVVSTAFLRFDQNALLSSATGTGTAMRLTLISMAQQHIITHFLAHLTMLHGAVPEAWLPNAAFTLVGQAWSISVEWQFYLIAPFLFLWLSTIRQWQSLIAIMMVIAVCLIYGRHTTSGFVGNNLSTFAVGFASYYFYRSDFQSLPVTLVRAGFLAMLVLGFFVMRQHLIGLAVWLMVFYAIIRARSSGRKNLLTSALMLPLVLYLGRISYSLYMVHMQVLFFLIWLFHTAHVPVTMQLYLLPFGCLISAAAVAAALHHTVEKPMHDFGKRISGKMSASPKVALDVGSSSHLG